MRYLRLFDIPGKVRVQIQFESRDLWVGVFWRTTDTGLFHLHICIVPTIPLHVTVVTRRFREIQDR